MRRHLRTVFAIVLTVGLLYLFFRTANLDQVSAEIVRAKLDLLIVAVFIAVGTYFLRAIRWQFLLNPIGPTRLSMVFRAVVIGFAASGVLPARAGEFLRPYLLGKWEGLSVAAAFATVLLERLLDLFIVTIFLLIFLFFFDPNTIVAGSTVYNTLKLGGVLAGGIGIAALAMIYFLTGDTESTQKILSKFERFLPVRVSGGFRALTQRFASGFLAIRQPVRLLQALLFSLLIWLSIATTIWLVSKSFHITLTVVDSFLLLVLLVVGGAAPTPGAVGGFHEAYRIGATDILGVPNDQAVGAAIVLHAVSFLPVILMAVVVMFRSGLYPLGVKRLVAEATNKSESNVSDPIRTVDASLEDFSNQEERIER